MLAASESKCVDRLYVSTDSEEIMSVGRQYGAEIIVRPPELCMPFIGRVAKGNPVSFPGDSVMGVVENLKQLDQQWDSLVMQFSE